MNITPPQAAPLKECARWLGADYMWLYAHVRAGNIPAENRGTEHRARYWCRPVDVQAYLDELRRSA